MMIDPIVFYSLAFIVSLLALVLGVLVVSYERTLQKTHKLEEDYDDLSSHLNEKAAKLFEEARRKALSIIEEANLKSGEIISEAKSFEDKSKKELSQFTNTLSEEQKNFLQEKSLYLIKNYQQTLEELRQKNVNLFKNISKDIESDAVSEIKDFRQVLEKETFASQKIVSEKIETEYQKLLEELKSYKEQKIKEIEESIYQLLLTISKKVIGKALNVEDQEELVMEALEKAKKENFFN